MSWYRFGRSMLRGMRSGEERKFGEEEREVQVCAGEDGIGDRAPSRDDNEGRGGCGWFEGEVRQVISRVGSDGVISCCPTFGKLVLCSRI